MKKTRDEAVIFPVSMLSKGFTIAFLKIFQCKQDKVFMNWEVKKEHAPPTKLWK